jgi:hypothetical protein
MTSSDRWTIIGWSCAPKNLAPDKQTAARQQGRRTPRPGTWQQPAPKEAPPCVQS